MEQDGQLLALIEVIPAADHLLIENIAVRPDHQGKVSANGFCVMRRARPFHGIGRDPALHECRFCFELGFLFPTRIPEYRRGTVVPGRSLFT